MDLEEQQLVIKWRSLNELKEKLRAVLGELESNTGSKTSAQSPPLQSYSEAIPDEIRKLGLNTFSSAMLSTLRETHVGRPNAIDAKNLAKEMKQRYPLLLAKKALGEIAHGTIFPGQKMFESGLIRMDKLADAESGHLHRLYWSE
jgi:hypothetical protein